jgi:hypothetical protein
LKFSLSAGDPYWKIARRCMDDIVKEEIERWLDWFETDVVPAVEYFRKCSKYKFI